MNKKSIHAILLAGIIILTSIIIVMAMVKLKQKEPVPVEEATVPEQPELIDQTSDNPPRNSSESNLEGTKEAESQIDTTDWKTYWNEEYGFEIKYPKNWILGKYKKNQYGTLIYITSPDVDKEHLGKLNFFGDNIEIGIFPFMDLAESLKKRAGITVSTIDEYLEVDRSQTELCKINETIVDGRRSYVVRNFGFTSYYSLIIENNQKYFFVAFEKKATDSPQEIEKVNEVCLKKIKGRENVDFREYLDLEEYGILKSFVFIDNP